jgi:iron complex outermembrane recepter protein
LGASALLMVGLALTPLSEAIAADTPVQHSATQFAFNLPAEAVAPGLE